MTCNSQPELFQLTVDRFLAQGRGELGRVQEDVNIFRKPLNEVPAL
jgi:hypothetical protein